MRLLRKPCLFALIILGLTVLNLNPAEKTTKTAADNSIKVMTFNVRTSNNEDDGVNNWNAGRKDRALKVITDHAPDILCVQEAFDGQSVPAGSKQVTDLQTLTQYAWYGVGRDTGKDLANITTGEEFEGIMYLKSRFTLKSSGQFWISWEPDTPHTTFATSCMDPGWDVGNSRMATWVILLDNVTGKKFFVLNQHWANPKETQPMSAILITKQISQLSNGLPIITTGDLNMSDDYPDAEYGLNPYNAYKFLLSGNCPLVLVDAYRSVQADPTVPPHEATYQGFQGGVTPWTGTNVGDNYRIDFILTKQFKTLNAEIVRDTGTDGSTSGLWPSDHYPVIAALVIY